MARRIDEPVMVRTVDGGGVPGTFIWRDRMYVVREVLSHWRERRSWWTGASARAVHGEVAPMGAAGPDVDRDVTLGHEREVWRVEASAGRVYAPGVYDLACSDVDRQATAAPPGQAWHLLHVAD